MEGSASKCLQACLDSRNLTVLVQKLDYVDCPDRETWLVRQHWSETGAADARNGMGFPILGGNYSKSFHLVVPLCFTCVPFSAVSVHTVPFSACMQFLSQHSCRSFLSMHAFLHSMHTFSAQKECVFVSGEAWLCNCCRVLFGSQLCGVINGSNQILTWTNSFKMTARVAAFP